MNRAAEKHLTKAETHLARGNEFYAKAADEIIAAKAADTSLSNKEIGQWFGYSGDWARSLVAWRTSGDDRPTPRSGSRVSQDPGQGVRETTKTLRSATAETIEEVLEQLPDEAVEKIEKAVSDEAVKRTVYADQPKPGFKEAKKKAAKKKARRLRDNPEQAASAFIASLGRGRAQVRTICTGYQDFLALVEDEEWREYVRELLVSFQANVNLALGEVLEGSLDDALARLLAEEEVK